MANPLLSHASRPQQNDDRFAAYLGSAVCVALQRRTAVRVRPMDDRRLDIYQLLIGQNEQQRRRLLPVVLLRGAGGCGRTRVGGLGRGLDQGNDERN